MPVLPAVEDALRLIKQRHHEWREFNRHWRFLADSYEGGSRYKMADYSIPCDVPASMLPAIVGQGHSGQSVGGYDTLTGLPNMVAFGRMSDRNLTPHLSETDPNNNDIYALRVARTPVPKKLEKVVRRHLSRIYAREVQRDGPTQLQDWWADVDGCGTPIDKWMRKTVAPLLVVLGHIDLCFDHPMAEDGSPIETRADLKAAGLDKCIASYILPENMLWWRLDRSKRYAECLVLERCGYEVKFRHWTDKDSTLYTHQAKPLETVKHPFGRVPIVRVFDDRKARCDNTGQPRYEAVADYQKAIYNGLSEQILADVEQSGPKLQGPEDFMQGEDIVTVGPNNILPMKKDSNGTGYTGWNYVDVPQGSAAERRQHLVDYGDEIDQSAALTKPAGTSGSGTVAQSGISKSFDDQQGNDYLAEVASTLEDCERMAAEFALLVLGDGTLPDDLSETLSILYPREFDLSTSDDLASGATNLQAVVGGSGVLPEAGKEYGKKMLRLDHPGLPEERRLELEKEIEDECDRQAGVRDQMAEANAKMMDSEADPELQNGLDPDPYNAAMTPQSQASN